MKLVKALFATFIAIVGMSLPCSLKAEMQIGLLNNYAYSEGIVRIAYAQVCFAAQSV